MNGVYNLLRETCGLSQQEAADFHDARLDSVKSWCSNRRDPPPGVIAELQDLARDITLAGERFAYRLKRIARENGNDNSFDVGLPHDEKDARACGFPSLTAAMRATAFAIAQLPDDAEIRLVERKRGSFPSATMQRGERKMKDIPAEGIAPGAPQTVVTSQPRTTSEFNLALRRLSAQDPFMFYAQKGAHFEATIEKFEEGYQASYRIFVDVLGGTNSTSDIRVFPSEAEALTWIDHNAGGRGFDRYPLEDRR